MNITVTTKPMPDGKIEQSVTLPQYRDDAHGHVMRWVMDTKEKGIREALIALGWTPPKEKSAVEKEIEDKIDAAWNYIAGVGQNPYRGDGIPSNDAPTVPLDVAEQEAEIMRRNMAKFPHPIDALFDALKKPRN